jgi:cytidylate kinase
LIRAKDAWYLDTSLQSVAELVKMIVTKIHELEEENNG